MSEFLAGITVYKIVTDIYDLLIGSALVFGALKWRRGLMTTTAFYWGLILGFIGGYFICLSMNVSEAIILITVIFGAIIFPILTYQIPSINRFVLGFIVTMKLFYMFTTYLCKEGYIEFGLAITLPIIMGTILGIIFMLLQQLSVLPFALGCVFIGASQIAPTLAKYVNQVIFGITQDYSILFDPISFIFALFKIELTDEWTLAFMIFFMGIGLPVQLRYIKEQGYDYDTPIIAFETDNPEMHGKIIS